MSRPPKVSIGLPVFNGELFIEEAMDSILAQTFEDFELIISDNASTDGTEEICRRYVEKDERVRYLRNRENLGAAYNYNQAFHLSRGEYFKWAAHDDVLRPEFVERCVEALDGSPSAVVAYPVWAAIDEAGRPVAGGYPRWKVLSPDPHDRFRFVVRMDSRTQTPIFGLFRSSALVKTGLHRPHQSGDHLLLAELSLYGPFVEVPEAVFLHREHPGRSVAIRSFRARVEWWLPASRVKKSGGSLDALRLYAAALTKQAVGHARSISRASISPRQKLLCYAELPGWALLQVRVRAERRLRERIGALRGGEP